MYNSACYYFTLKIKQKEILISFFLDLQLFRKKMKTQDKPALAELALFTVVKNWKYVCISIFLLKSWYIKIYSTVQCVT